MESNGVAHFSTQAHNKLHEKFLNAMMIESKRTQKILDLFVLKHFFFMRGVIVQMRFLFFF